MELFMSKNIVVSKIEIACFVASGEGSPVHINRASHGLVLSTSDKKKYTFDNGKEILSDANHIIYLPKNSNYTVDTKKGDCYAINFEMQNEEEFNPFAFKIKNKALFTDLFKHAESAWRKKQAGFEMKCMAELYQILFNMRKEFEDSYITKQSSDLIRPAVSYIHEKYTSDVITISDLATMCNMSETYFRIIFKNTFGTSPLKYINRLRIERAKELLLSGMYQITEVSQMSGFNDECYFSREFKKTVGVCPSEYKADF